MKPTAINKFLEWLKQYKETFWEHKEGYFYVCQCEAKARQLAKAEEESKATDGGCDCCEYQLRDKLSRHEKGAK